MQFRVYACIKTAWKPIFQCKYAISRVYMHKMVEIFSKSRFLSDHFNDHFVKIFQTKVSDHSATIIFSIILFWNFLGRFRRPAIILVNDHYGGKRLYINHSNIFLSQQKRAEIQIGKHPETRTFILSRILTLQT